MTNFFHNPLQSAAGTASKSRLPPLALEPLDFNYKHGETVDMPMDTSNVSMQFSYMLKYT